MYSEKDVPFSVYECHYWWDLDEDGYAEPYIVTVLDQTQEILRIVPRFDTTRISVKWDANEEKVIQRIDSYEYIIAYKFLPDIDSSIYEGSWWGKCGRIFNARLGRSVYLRRLAPLASRRKESEYSISSSLMLTPRSAATALSLR